MIVLSSMGTGRWNEDANQAMEYEASSSTNGTMIALITSGVSVTIGRTIRSPDHIVQVVRQTGGRLWGSLEILPVAVQCRTHRSGSARLCWRNRLFACPFIANYHSPFWAVTVMEPSRVALHHTQITRVRGLRDLRHVPHIVLTPIARFCAKKHMVPRGY